MACDIWQNKKFSGEIVIVCKFDRKLMRECGGMDRERGENEVSSHENKRGERETSVSQLARLIPCENRNSKERL
jgi:hypothetical protein